MGLWKQPPIIECFPAIELTLCVLMPWGFFRERLVVCSPHTHGSLDLLRSGPPEFTKKLVVPNPGGFKPGRLQFLPFAFSSHLHVSASDHVWELQTNFIPPDFLFHSGPEIRVITTRGFSLEESLESLKSPHSLVFHSLGVF